MILFKKSKDLKNFLEEQRKQGIPVGFIPTMGALHEGHLSLLDKAKTNKELTVCSIFINPTQFNDPGDFSNYPVTLENDITLLEGSGCEILFLPDQDEIYPSDSDEQPFYDLGILETVLEGHYRPGHFQGVCMVVDRLLSIVNPASLYLGQKDYQQCLVIKKLLKITGHHKSTEIVICPTLRESNGLAMSSRNMHLTKEEKKQAGEIYQSLQLIKGGLAEGDLEDLKRKAMRRLIEKNFKVDYIEIADAETLQPAFRWDGDQKLIALAAAFLGKIRLIDNLPLN